MLPSDLELITLGIPQAAWISLRYHRCMVRINKYNNYRCYHFYEFMDECWNKIIKCVLSRFTVWIRLSVNTWGWLMIVAYNCCTKRLCGLKIKPFPTLVSILPWSSSFIGSCLFFVWESTTPYKHFSLFNYLYGTWNCVKISGVYPEMAKF